MFIGTAGWSVAKDLAQHLEPAESALQRYASVFSGVEINSSSYRRHRPDTWQRWHDSVPAQFRFSVKVPKIISHELRLAGAVDEVQIFLSDIAPLGDKLGPPLLQLPPSLAFEPRRDEAFFAEFRQLHAGRIVIEPRHISWRSDESRAVLTRFDIGRAYADPDPAALNDLTAPTAAYLRLHGSPKHYYSEYSADQLAGYAARLQGVGDAWCIFDNTASGAALRNALDLNRLVQRSDGTFALPPD